MTATAGKQWLPYPWQLDVWEHLHQQRLNKRLPHALLVHGEKGSGKYLLAENFGKTLLCMEKGEFACGACKACQLFAAGSHPDYVTIGLEEKSRQIKVDQIRAVVDFVSKTAQMGGMKVVVIEPAETMNINAANALLKCLEEPSGDTVIILVSHAPSRLLPTIRSRCQNIAMPKPSAAQADQWLATFVSNMQERQQLLLLANGNPLLALEYQQQEVLDLYRKMIDQLIGLKAGNASLIRQAEELQKLDLVLVLQIQQKILWCLIQAGLKVADLEAMGLSSFSPVVAKAQFSKRAYKMLDELQEALREAQGPSNPNAQLLLESLLMHWQALLRV